MANNLPVKEKISLSELISLIREQGFIREANLIAKIANEIPYGEINLITHGGRIKRVKATIEYDELSDGL